MNTIRQKIGLLILVAFVAIFTLSCGSKKESSQPAEYHSINDLKGHKVAIMQGSSYEFALKDSVDIELQYYSTHSEIILAITSGKADCGILDNVVVMNADLQSMGVEATEIDGFDTDVAVAFSKENSELRRNFNAFLNEIKSNGKFDEIYNRWCLGNIDDAVMPKIDIPTNGKTIVAAMLDDQVPFAFIKNNEMSGFEVELIKTWANHENYSLVIERMPFPSMIAALQSGKADVALACMSITEERKKSIDFSDPYYLCRGCCITKANDTNQSTSVVQWIKNGFQKNVLEEDRWKMILDGLWETLVITFGALIFGTLLAMGICYLRMRKNKVACGFAKFYITFMRGIPILVLLMILFYVVFADAGLTSRWIAIIAFSMNFAAYAGEIFRGGIEGVDNGQWEAGWAMGFSKLKTFAYFIMPQSLKQIIPVYKGEVISLLKGTSIVGYIAIQDLTKVSDIIRGRTFDAFFPLLIITVIYFLLAWLLGLAIEKLSGVNKIH